MSHRFSSTFDALQAHFAKKSASTGAVGKNASQSQPPSAENTEKANHTAAGQVSVPSHPASIRHPVTQLAPNQGLDLYTGSWNSRHEAPSAVPHTVTTPAGAITPTPSNSSLGNTRIDSRNHLQPPGSQSYNQAPLHSQHMHSSGPVVEHANSNPIVPGLPPSSKVPNPPSQDPGSADSSSAARYIAQAVNSFMNGSATAVQDSSLKPSESNPTHPRPSQSLDTQDQITPMDTGVDSLLQRQNELRELEASRGNGSQLEKRDVEALNGALQQTPINTKGSSRGTKRKNVPSNKYFEEGGHDSSLPPVRGRGRGRRRGPRKAAEPTGDVKLRLNMASEAYLQGRIDDAIQLVEDAIRINAEIHRAWILLAQLFEERGELRKRLTAQICAAQLEPKNIDGWLSVAQQAVALRDMYPDDADELTRQAIFCYSGALRSDNEHRTARHSRAALVLDRGYYKGAAKDYTFLANRLYYDVYALRGLAETTVLLAETSKRKQPTYTPESAIDAYRRCIDHFRESGFDEEYPFEWEDVYIFVDLLGYVKQFREGIHELKSLARWLLDRSEESFWDYFNDDLVDDDREWDADNVRRLEVPGFQEGKSPDASYGNGLPLQLRAKLGVYRLELGQEDEAMVSDIHVRS